MQFIDKYGYPVEIVKGRKVHNFLRRLIHTREIKFEVNTDKAFRIIVAAIVLTIAVGLTAASLLS